MHVSLMTPSQAQMTSVELSSHPLVLEYLAQAAFDQHPVPAESNGAASPARPPPPAAEGAKMRPSTSHGARNFVQGLRSITHSMQVWGMWWESAHGEDCGGVFASRDRVDAVHRCDAGGVPGGRAGAGAERGSALGPRWPSDSRRTAIRCCFRGWCRCGWRWNVDP